MSAILDENGDPTWHFNATLGGEPVFFPAGFAMRNLTNDEIIKYIKREVKKGDATRRDNNQKNAKDYYDSVNKRNAENLLREKELEDKKKTLADLAAGFNKSYSSAEIRLKEKKKKKR